MLLSYMNGIQAIYLLPSLGQEIDISVVRLEMWRDYDPYNNYQVITVTKYKEQGTTKHSHSSAACAQGDREPLLDSFCQWQEGANPRADSDPGHWDVALLVSGLNFYAVDGRGRKVKEFPDIDTFGKPLAQCTCLRQKVSIT